MPDLLSYRIAIYIKKLFNGNLSFCKLFIIKKSKTIEK